LGVRIRARCEKPFAQLAGIIVCIRHGIREGCSSGFIRGVNFPVELQKKFSCGEADKALFAVGLEWEELNGASRDQK
jgi:hypothetical protein